MSNLIRGCIIAFLFALIGSLCVRAQENPLCGTEPTNQHADYVLVACVDYEALRAIAPSVPWPAGKHTQVLVHAKSPGAVCAILDGEKRCDETVQRDDGRNIVMLVFPRAGYKEMVLRFYSRLQ